MTESSNSHSLAGPIAEGRPSTAMLQRQLAQTPSLLPLIERLALVAEHDVPVLLTGETGTGKTRLARIIHDCSRRADQPFVTVPCGALPPLLIESELFGHVRGAFTGADRSRMGKLGAAGRGTLLLDEIDTLGLEQQAKLLCVLDNGEYEPVGGNDALRRACRIVAASNANLDELVRSGKFRSDLYYRLLVMPFHMPPLRGRVRDIAPLARDLAARYAAQFRKELADISPEALADLESYSWPGNIRELDNVVRQAVLLSRSAVLLPCHLPAWVRKGAVHVKPPAAAAGNPLEDEREAAEWGLIRRVFGGPRPKPGRCGPGTGHQQGDALQEDEKIRPRPGVRICLRAAFGKFILSWLIVGHSGLVK